MAGLGGLILVSLLGGCAGAAPTPRPTDYPLPESWPWPQLDIHWRLATEAGTTRAAGLVVRRIDSIREARLQLIGLDGAARIVFFRNRRRLAGVGPGMPSPSRSPSRLTEQRYEVRVLSVQYRDGGRR
jgi:hypothetical protein